MAKNKFAFIILLIGLILFFYSWYASYPITLRYPGDIVFNHISPFYWISLPLVLSSLYLIGAFSKNQPLRCIASISIILSIYSISFFYFSMATPDAQYFNGLTQNFINTKSLDPSQLSHEYYQWPSFFLLAYIATSVSGLSVVAYQFVLYAIIGSLLAVSLYIYASKHFNNGAILSVAAFFVSLFYFFNYQAVPFSLALSLLFVLFVLENRKKSATVIVTTFILFFCVSIAHSFVALFFVLYLLFRTIIARSKLYAELCLVATNIFLITQFTLSSYWIGLNIQSLFRLPTEYGSIIGATLNAPATVPSPLVSATQNISRILTLTIISLCLIGFLLLFLKRKLSAIDGAIFFAGATYSVLGLALSSLGERALAIVFIPVSLGVTYLFQTKYKKIVTGIFLIAIICFISVPIHNSFNSYPLTFQTKEDMTTSSFMLEKYNWDSHSIIITDLAKGVNLVSQIEGHTQIDTNSGSTLGLANIAKYDSIMYSIDLENSLQNSGISLENNSKQVLQQFNIVYNSGSDFIVIKSK